MASTYSTLAIELMATGENSTTWGNITNTNLGTALEEAIVGSADVTFASADVTLTITNDNTSQTARNVRLRCIGTTGGSTRNLIIPKTAGTGPATFEKPYIIQNDCADSIVVKHSTGTGITVPAGKTMWVYANGTNVVDVANYLTSLTLATALPITSGGTGSIQTAYCNLQANVTGVLPVANGGTGGNTEALARTGLGATTVGANLFTLTNPSAITFPRFNADNTVSALDAATFRAAIGAGTGTGSVTSVAALTLGTTGTDLSSSVVNSSSTPVITLNVPTASATNRGVLSSADWTAFNGKAASGANTDITALDQDVTVTASGTIAANTIGYRGIPQNAQTATYTLALSDAGKHISITTGGVVVPANSSIAFPVGSTISVYNDSASNQSISITTDTMYLAGTATTGTRTLAQRGIATLVKVSATTWVISGGGLS